MQHINPRNTAPREKLIANPKARLQAQVAEVMRFRQLSLRTAEAY
jgi:hypothetical protein